MGKWEMTFSIINNPFPLTGYIPTRYSNNIANLKNNVWSKIKILLKKIKILVRNTNFGEK